MAVEHLPKGWIIKSGKPHPDFRNFGTVDFPFELSEKDVQGFQLTLVAAPNPEPQSGQPNRKSHVRQSMAASIIAAARNEGLPIYRAPTKRAPSRPGVYVRPGGSGPILVEWWGDGKEGWSKVLAIIKKLGYYAERPSGEDGPIWVAPAGFKGWGRGPSANPVGATIYLGNRVMGGYLQKPAVYLRFGKPPKNGAVSMNGFTGRPEKGVSVYKAWKDERTGKYVIETPNGEFVGTQESFIAGDRQIYEVTGADSGRSGADGEDLLDAGTVKVVRKVKRSEVVTDSDPWMDL
ncbi:MAG: hypothetical protein Q7R39_15995, partial [Dehalococcoidia bacterium]|nr:hypothetical protein [Dehalococcoidia bacterium]